MDNIDLISEIIGVFVSNTYYLVLYDRAVEYLKNNKYLIL